MADYIKATNFTTKDSLAPGSALKRVQGTELDTEFNAIATAIGTKSDKASPNLTGTPTAPTAAYGTNTTQIATTAFVQAALQALYPVGTIYTSVVSTNPGTLFGFGTWVAFGAGKVMVGIDAGDASFDTVEETGGSKNAITVAHTHTGSTSSDGAHTHQQTTNGLSFDYQSAGSYSSSTQASHGTTASTAYTLSSGTHNHSFTTDSAGSSGTNANLQPYIVVYMWKRTV